MPLSQRCNQSVQRESSLAVPTTKSNSLDHAYEASTIHRVTTQTHCTFLRVFVYSSFVSWATSTDRLLGSNTKYIECLSQEDKDVLPSSRMELDNGLLRTKAGTGDR